MFAGHLIRKQGGSRRDPAGIAAHQLHHNHMDGQCGGVLGDFQSGYSRIFGRASKARAMIRHRQVVVNGLGDSDHPQLIAALGGQLIDLIAGVHGIVAAVIEEITDVEPLEAFQHRRIVRIRQLAAAGAQGGGWGLGQQGQVFPVHLTKIQQIPCQDAFRAKARTIDGLDFRMEFCLPHSPQQGAVDHRGRAAAMGNKHVSFQHDVSPFYTPCRPSSFMHRCTAPSLKVWGRAKILGLGPVNFRLASSMASSKVARVLRPMPRAMPGSWAPTM